MHAGWREVSVWRWLAETAGAEALVAEAVRVFDAAAGTGIDAAGTMRLRRLAERIGAEAADLARPGAADLAAAALELAAARRKAVVKFGAVAERLWADVQGVEQASSLSVARWKARRVRAALDEGAPILDICCGVGGDAIALVEAGLQVEAIDLDPRRAWMSARNAGCASRVAAAESLELAGAVLHADPARRDEASGRRRWSLDGHAPGRDWIEGALSTARAAAIKFSPGVDRAAFGSLPIEWEFIEEDGRLVQAVAWSGAFATQPGVCVATAFGTEADATSVAHSLRGTPDERHPDGPPPVDPALTPGAFLSEPRAVVERAALLVEALGGRAAHALAPRLGLFTSAAPLDEGPLGHWWESFEIVAECAPRAEAVAATLASADLVARSVRVRGQALDADRLTRALAARPDGRGVVLAWREGQRARTVVVRAR
jgi:SAM-dependent methyltransferase